MVCPIHVFRALPELRAHPDYCTNPKRVKHRDGLLAILVDRFECKTTAAWSGLLADSGLAYGPINDTGQVFADPQVIHRDMVRARRREGRGEGEGEIGREEMEKGIIQRIAVGRADRARARLPTNRSSTVTW